IVELLTRMPELENLVGKGPTADQLSVAARAGGMKSLWESGLRHVLSGDSTVDELLRVTDPPQVIPEKQAAAPGRTERPARAGRSVSPTAPPTPQPPPAPAPVSLDFMMDMALIDDSPPSARGIGTCVLLV